MKLGKNMALIGLGVGATLAYQKYSKPIMKTVKKKFNKDPYFKGFFNY